MTTGVPDSFVRAVAKLSSAVLAGVALTVLVLELALRRLDGPGYVRVRKAEFSYFNWFIGLVLAPTLIAVVVLVVQTRRSHSRLLSPELLALGLLMVAIAITLVVNGPINLEQLKWNPAAPPPNWSQVRDRWQIAHAARTAVLVLNLAVLYLPPSRRAGASER
jgi:hypothetical protein